MAKKPTKRAAAPRVDFAVESDGLPIMKNKVKVAYLDQTSCRCVVCKAMTAYWRTVKYGVMVKCSLCNTTAYLNSPLGVEIWKAKSRSVSLNPEVEAIYFSQAILPLMNSTPETKLALTEAIFGKMTENFEGKAEKVEG